MARRASVLKTVTSPVRSAKRWVREAVLGVVGTAVAAGLLAAFGLNGNSPVIENPNTPQGQLAKAVEKAAVEAKEKVIESAKNGQFATVSTKARSAVDALLGGGGANAGSETIVGQWEQLVYNPGNNQWYSGGIFRVSGQPSTYSMAYLDYSRPTPEFVEATGITDIRLTNGDWTFTSRIDVNEVLTFNLRRVDEQTYQGYCYQNGQQVAANTWRRVK